MNTKSPKLSPTDFATVSAMAALLMEMNARNDENAGGYSSNPEVIKRGTYRHLSNAIVAFVLNQTGVDISNVDWNMGGNLTWGHDIQAAIASAVAQKHDEERQALCDASPDGDLGFAQVKKYLGSLGLRIKRDATPAETNFIVSFPDESAAGWFISSSLLHCVYEGQRKFRSALAAN